MHAHLSNFSVNYGKDHALLIVYYAGHGWHSCDRSRENPGRFDLHPRKLEYQEVPSGDELVMWEVSETILHHVKGDVLVIFDCCDTGSLAKLRSAGRAFEYLGACDGGKYTYEPGEKSFTSALTWALKTMSSEPAFTTADLVAKIKTHRRFPTNQKPVLFPRWDFMPEHIWISSRRTLVTRTSGRHRSRSAREFRDENCDFVDFRVTFSRPLGDEDGKAVAEMMGPLVCNRKLPLNARHVSFLRKGTCKSRKDLTALWNRAQNHIIATQRLRKTVDIPDTKLNQKRKRPSFDADSEDPSLRKYPKSSLVSDSEHAAQLPATPSSGNPDSDPEGTSRLRISTNIGPSSGILESSFEMESDPMHRAEALLRDLEKLKLYALHQPEFQRAFLSQIQARFMS
ncbi:hypothetical protein K458DRAFT_48872 [Lentithecium fluviatile CBS 122367]|uniref:Uncharacterized protein n=1 Tax=Lentithecium fluviatile CBS 122367 TaxID=1168545 RepID=A0A6G1IXH2_9PLEO|nr:hypothetical protein K458DRAFT_48872 [Lentithecium fluviatile CBS 122367]